MDEKMYNEAICGGLIPFLLRCVRTHGFVYIIKGVIQIMDVLSVYEC